MVDAFTEQVGMAVAPGVPVDHVNEHPARSDTGSRHASFDRCAGEALGEGGVLEGVLFEVDGQEDGFVVDRRPVRSVSVHPDRFSV